MPDSPDCTIKNEKTGLYYDLRPLSRDSGDDWEPEADSDMKFKLNVCHSLLSTELDLKDPEGVASWGKKTLKGTSLGKLSKIPVFKGDNLILRYQDGDGCPEAPNYRKSTTIRFQCDTSVSGQGVPVLISEENGCTFWFDWKTPAACGSSTAPGNSVGGNDGGGSGLGIFWTLIIVAAVVYFIGGIAYNRIVHQARGFKQIPNYNAIASGLDFCKDMLIIIFAKCYRPKRNQTSYHNLPVDTEINTLIDDDYVDDDDEEEV